MSSVPAAAVMKSTAWAVPIFWMVERGSTGSSATPVTTSCSGGDGDDVLDGGADDDELRGGKGFDYYLVGEGHDQIIDEDGEGMVLYKQLEDGKLKLLPVAGSFVRQSDGSFRFLGDASIKATHNSPLTLYLPGGATVVVQDHDNGDLGVNLVETIVTSTAYNEIATLVSVLTWLLHITSGAPTSIDAPSTADRIVAELPQSILATGSGRNGIYGLLHGGGGDDRIEANDDRDVLFGESGNDILIGSSGHGLIGNGSTALLDTPGADFLSGGARR